MTMSAEQTNKRTRMNVSVTAKGLAQWDVTAEYDSPEESQRHLMDGIQRVREAIKAAGLKEVGQEA
jgi:hypothetical protein